MSSTAEVDPEPEHAPTDATWQLLRQAWLAPRSDAPLEADHGRWSAFELSVVGALAGAASFPTIGPTLGGLDDETAAVVVQVVLRSLMARGLVSGAADGSAVLSDGGWVAAAVGPDLAVTVERTSSTAPVAWFGLSGDHVVQIVVDIDGSRQVTGFHASALVDRVVAVLAPTSESSERPTMSGLDATAITAVVAGGMSIMRVSTSWREGEGVVGGVFNCALDEHGAAWAVEASGGDGDPVWNLHPVDHRHVRQSLLDHLPSPELGRV